MALPQLVNNSNAAALVTASGNGEYLLSLLVNKASWPMPPEIHMTNNFC
ncbi:hypothetical protein [Streptomyces sp. 11x1]|nr:hypothetical protein [Streptomyces sp. 11x1]WNZ11742.1 hypothetical protein P8T65_32135 [Streptomyces sp. 11x1]